MLIITACLFLLLKRNLIKVHTGHWPQLSRKYHRKDNEAFGCIEGYLLEDPWNCSRLPVNACNHCFTSWISWRQWTVGTILFYLAAIICWWRCLWLHLCQHLQEAARWDSALGCHYQAFNNTAHDCAKTMRCQLDHIEGIPLYYGQVFSSQCRTLGPPIASCLEIVICLLSNKIGFLDRRSHWTSIC